MLIIHDVFTLIKGLTFLRQLWTGNTVQYWRFKTITGDYDTGYTKHGLRYNTGNTMHEWRYDTGDTILAIRCMNGKTILAIRCMNGDTLHGWRCDTIRVRRWCCFRPILLDNHRFIHDFLLKFTICWFCRISLHIGRVYYALMISMPYWWMLGFFYLIFHCDSLDSAIGLIGCYWLYQHSSTKLCEY